jgi:hypothetical protein
MRRPTVLGLPFQKEFPVMSIIRSNKRVKICSFLNMGPILQISYICNLQMFKIIWSVCPWKAILADAYQSEVLYSRVGSLPYPQALD